MKQLLNKKNLFVLLFLAINNGFSFFDMYKLQYNIEPILAPNIVTIAFKNENDYKNISKNLTFPDYRNCNIQSCL